MVRKEFYKREEFEALGGRSRSLSCFPAVQPGQASAIYSLSFLPLPCPSPTPHDFFFWIHEIAMGFCIHEMHQICSFYGLLETDGTFSNHTK